MLAYIMQRTTVKISDELDARLRHEAVRSGRTISEVTRDALERYLGQNGRLSFTGAGRSGRVDVSERIEEILRDEAGR
jgi:predicted DNA-binding protein